MKGGLSIENEEGKRGPFLFFSLARIFLPIAFHSLSLSLFNPGNSKLVPLNSACRGVSVCEINSIFDFRRMKHFSPVKSVSVRGGGNLPPGEDWFRIKVGRSES